MLREMRIIKKIAIILVISILISGVSGCWNNVDLADMAIAISIGLDICEENKDLIQVTVQLVKPGVIRAKSEGSDANPVWVFTAKGKTVFSAVRNLLKTVNRKVFFNHVQLIIIGEELAEKGIKDIVDFFERDHETNRQSHVLITKGVKAKQILTSKSQVGDIPGLYIVQIIKNNGSLAKMKVIKMYQLIQILNIPGYNSLVGRIQVAPKQRGKKFSLKDIEVEGAGILEDGKLVGWLGPIETRGYLFAKGEVKSGIINTANPFLPEKKVGFEIVRSSGNLSAEIEKGKLGFRIEVDAEGRLGDQQGPGDLASSELIEKLETEVEKVIEKNIREAIEIAQNKYQNDFFGFAEKVQKNYYQFWEQTESEWKGVFSRTPVTIDVNWKTRSTGIIKKTTEPK